MASPHFLLFPFMAQGHMIPMIDLAKLLARRGAIITIVTTPLNAARHRSTLARAIDSGLQIRVVELNFPCKEVGLPEGCENFDLLPSLGSASTFFRATFRLYDPSEKVFDQLRPSPTCIISDACLPWTLKLAHKHNIPRLVFYSLSCFFLLCLRSLELKESVIRSVSDSEFVTLVDLPNRKFEFRKAQLPKPIDDEMTDFTHELNEADRISHGVIINTFEEMEPEYLSEYKNTRSSPEKVWCIGPASLSNVDKLDRAERGNKAAIDEHECIKWLDGQHPSSVVYVSLGSLCNFTTPQLIELGLGLEASNKPFIWVIRKEIITEELLKWVEEYNFEAKIKGRGVLIRGWSPQILILSHPAIGCFLTHCGWNSSIEGMSAGVPMITWPLFADQVFNETLIVEILGIGVRVGGVEIEEELKGVVVKGERVREAIEMVMDDDEIRERCREFAKKAKSAMEEGGSSQKNLKLLIDDIVAVAYANGGSLG